MDLLFVFALKIPENISHNCLKIKNTSFEIVHLKTCII